MSTKTKRLLERYEAQIRLRCGKRTVPDYLRNVKAFVEWLEERCVINPNHISRFRDLYTDYKDWTAQVGSPAMTTHLFGRKLQERGFKRPPGGDRRYRGLALDKDLPPAG